MQMQEGYNSKIGEGGNKLSGDKNNDLVLQEQFSKNPDILILDEATSH